MADVRYTRADGTVITEAAFPASAWADPANPRRIDQEVYEEFRYTGESGFTGRRLKYRVGQVVPQAEIDALFTDATVSAIAPSTGPAAGGTVVTITGTGFRGASGVTFGGTAGTAFSVVSDTEIRVTTPAKVAGAYSVVVQDDAGNVTAATSFTYT